jgi:hypothetical protein
MTSKSNNIFRILGGDSPTLPPHTQLFALEQLTPMDQRVLGSEEAFARIQILLCEIKEKEELLLADFPRPLSVKKLRTVRGAHKWSEMRRLWMNVQQELMLYVVDLSYEHQALILTWIKDQIASHARWKVSAKALNSPNMPLKEFKE